MKIPFYKYQGTGNDFVLISNLDGALPAFSREQVARMCDRRFGIGADGLMLLEAVPGADFRMVYYNADGGESTMCGNGGRCIVAFAHHLGLIGAKTQFIAIDGPHGAKIHPNGTVSLEMQDVKGISHSPEEAILNTGSPHLVRWVDHALTAPVVTEGRSLRHEARFAPGGTNVNFVERQADGKLYVRTFERGVEDETLSCGTGVTAAAIAATGSATGQFSIQITTPGGQLEVSFTKETADSASAVVLTGPAQLVFQGEITL